MIVDGDAVFIAADDFVDLQESEVAWVDVPLETIRDFQRRDMVHRGAWAQVGKHTTPMTPQRLVELEGYAKAEMNTATFSKIYARRHAAHVLELVGEVRRVLGKLDGEEAQQWQAAGEGGRS